MNVKKISQSVAAVAASSAMFMPVAAQAQLEEVVVTARKRAESMQDAPLAVSAVNREKIEAAALGDATGIAQFAPNVVFDDISAGTPGGGGISIRGISYQDVEKTFDPAVLMYLDGVPLGTNTGNAMNLLDIERIEVLRGPQGTLFGKNAVGGVINIHRTKPILGRWAGKARVGVVDEDSSMDLEGVLNVPLGENLAAKLTVAELEDPAYYDNVTTGADEGGSEEQRYGIHLLWQATDSLQAEVQYNKSEKDGTLAPMLSINGPQQTLCAAFGACAVGPNTPLSGDRRKGAGDLRQGFFLDSEDYQLDLNWDINEYLTGVLIAAHRESDERTRLDFDGSPQELFHVERTSGFEQDSLEIRLDYQDERLSLTGGYFNWNAEVPYWSNEADISIQLGLPEDACGGSIPWPASTKRQVTNRTPNPCSSRGITASPTTGTRFWVRATSRKPRKLPRPVACPSSIPPHFPQVAANVPTTILSTGSVFAGSPIPRPWLTRPGPRVSAVAGSVSVR